VVVVVVGAPGRGAPLPLVVEGEQPESDRLAGEQRRLREARRRGIRHVFEMRSAAADDDSQRHDRVGPGVEGGPRDDGQLEAAGNPNHRDGSAGRVEHTAGTRE
jgi:hypothetical protein